MNKRPELGSCPDALSVFFWATLSRPQTVGMQIVENDLVSLQFDHTEKALWLSGGVNVLKNFG